MRTRSPRHTAPREVGHAGNRYVMTDYFGRHTAEDPGPQAYLVQQWAPELRAHFHEVDQFQVVLRGAGTLGRDEAGSGTVHYTDAFTTYGPIRTDPRVGVAYFTLRRTPTTGINHMPEEREKRAQAGGLGEHFTCQAPDDVGERPVELARTSRGAAAYACRPSPGTTVPGVGPSGPREGYVVVLAGELSTDGTHGTDVLPAASLVHFDDPVELSRLTAGEDCALAVVLFPPAEER